MDDSAVFVPSPTKKRKISEENSNEEGTTATGVVIWDIDDTIVVIQASLKLANEAHQSDLVKCVKDYLFAYLEKEFHFSDTMHMKVVERLSEWDEELINPVECGFAAERRDESLIHQDANDITARGSSYSNFLKSHYRSFQTSETTSCKPHVIDNVESSASIENCCVVENKDPLSSNSAQVYDRLPPGWKGVFDAMESRTFLWTHHARTVLSHLKKKKVRNMIITASEIAPAIAKLIMWGLFEYFDIDDIYSSANKPKTGVFLHLLKDLGNCSNPPQFVVACGDGPDEERASNHFSIPFQKINSPQDLYAVPGLLSKEYDIPVPDKYFPRTETSSTNSPLSKKTTQNKIVTFDKGLLSDCHKKLVLYTSDLKNSKKNLRETAEVEDNIIVEAKTSQ